MIEDEEAVGDEDDDDVRVMHVDIGDYRRKMEKIERLERVGRLLEGYGCRGC